MRGLCRVLGEFLWVRWGCLEVAGQGGCGVHERCGVVWWCRVLVTLALLRGKGGGVGGGGGFFWI